MHLLSHAQVSAISATQGRAKIDRSVFFAVTGQALMIHAVLQRLALHSMPSELTQTHLAVFASVARSLINQTQGIRSDMSSTLADSISSCSWGGWILLAGLALFDFSYVQNLVDGWIKTWTKVFQDHCGSKSSASQREGGAQSQKYSPQQAENAAQQLVPAATALLCFCVRNRARLASRTAAEQGLSNTLLKLLLLARSRVCTIAMNGSVIGSTVGGPQSSAALLYAIVLAALRCFPAKRYASAHKPILIDSVQMFADKAFANSSLSASLLRSRDAAACPLEMVRAGSM